MRKSSFHFLRVGLAITFLWIGILIFRNPEAWGGYLEPWAAGLLPIPLSEAMIGTAIIDIIIGALLLTGLIAIFIDSFPQTIRNKIVFMKTRKPEYQGRSPEHN